MAGDSITEVPEALAGFKHLTRQRVVWGDMDSMSHVNNTVYFRYMETARIDFLRQLTTSFATPEGNQIGDGIALAETRCRFKVSLQYPDEVIIGSAVREIFDQQFIVQHEIWSTAQGLIAAEGDARMVHYDFINSRKADIDGEFLQQLEQFKL